MLGACASVAAATVYKWVDENGVTHYSDQPNPKAEKLQISGAQTYASAQAAPVSAPARAAVAAPAVCSITTPGPGQVYLDTFSVSGHVALSHISEGDEATLRLDGSDISPLLGSDGSFELAMVDRGEHTLTLQVVNGKGDVTCQANAVTFSVRQRTAGTGGDAAPMAPTAPAAPMSPKVPGAGSSH